MRKLKKRLLGLGIGVSTITTSLGGVIGTATTVSASVSFDVATVESANISLENYANKEQLMSMFDTNSSTSDKIAKTIYFGQDNANNSTAQEWYIVGKDERKDPETGKSDNKDNIVLYAKDTVGGYVPFNNATSYRLSEKMLLTLDSTITRGATTSSIGTYFGAGLTTGNGTKVINSVALNHYGNSDLRKFLQTLTDGSGYFTESEKAQMLKSKITSFDTENKKYYYNEDYLYVPYAAAPENNSAYAANRYFMTVGHSEVEVYKNDNTVSGTNLLNKGLRIDNEYYAKGEAIVWSRTAMSTSEQDIAISSGNTWGSGKEARTNRGQATFSSGCTVPAFDLSLDNVLFASSAVSAAAFTVKEGGSELTTSYDGTTANPFTLRYKGNVGNGSYNNSNQSFKISGVGNNTYFVVQNGEGAYAVRVKNGDNIKASDITINGKKLTSFSGANVWLERYDRNTNLTTAAILEAK